MMRNTTGTILVVWLLMVAAAAAQDAYEPDDVYTSATLLVVGVAQHNHSIDPVGDVDWFTFTLPQSGFVSIETSGASGDTYMQLYGADGTTQIAFDDNDGEGFFSLIFETDLTSGVYTVKVEESGNNASIANYSISLSFDDQSLRDAYEPDDGPTSATAIAANTTQTAHSIFPIGDEDWVTFTLTERSHILLGTAAPNEDTRMWLYEADGTTLVEYDDDGGYGVWSLISRTLDAGTYLAKVDEYGNNGYIHDYSIYLIVADAPEALVQFGQGDLIAADYSPSTTTAQIATVSPGKVQLWDPDTGAMTGSWDTSSDATPLSVAFSPDGNRIAVGDNEDDIGIWSVSSGARVTSFPIAAGDADNLAFSPDGGHLLVCGNSLLAHLYDINTGLTTQTFIGHTGTVVAGTYSPDGAHVATASLDNTVRVWDVTNGTSLLTFSDHTDSVWCVAWSPDGTTIASGGDDTSVLVWDATTGVVSKTYTDHSASVRAVEFSPDGSLLLSADADGRAVVRDLATDIVLAEQTGHTGAIHTGRFSPDGLKVLTAGNDQTAYVWSALSGAAVSSISGFSAPVNGVAISRDNSQVLTADDNGMVTVWNAETGAVVKSLRAHTNAVNAIAFSPDGSQFATASSDDTAKIWNATTYVAQNILIGHTDVVRSVAFSPNGDYVATAGDDLTARLWDASTGAPIRTYTGHTQSIRSVSFSPDGTRILTGSSDAVVRAWDANSTATIMVFHNTGFGIYAATYSPGGQWIFAGDSYGGCWRWDATTGQCLDSDRLHCDDELLALVALPGGRHVVGAGGDGYALLNNEPGTLTTRAFGKHIGGVRAVAVSRYGTRVATGGADGIAYLWDSGVPRPTGFVEAQTISIESDGTFWAMAFDYTTGQVFSSLTATGSGSLDFEIAVDHWFGAYLYDYASGAYARGLYGLHQSLNP